MCVSKIRRRLSKPLVGLNRLKTPDTNRTDRLGKVFRRMSTTSETITPHHMEEPANCKTYSRPQTILKPNSKAVTRATSCHYGGPSDYTLDLWRTASPSQHQSLAGATCLS